MIKLLHFADAHIDLARHGRRDSQSGLPLRVLDFLNSLDTIVDAAISEKVDLVIFAGDAYRDRQPAPTYQREWGKRIQRLSSNNILTLMVIGNHDISPALGRAHTLQEFETLQVPNTRVIDRPVLLKPGDLNGLPLQVIGIPWLNRSGLASSLEAGGADSETVGSQLEDALTHIIEELLDQLDPSLPTVLTSHVSVQGARYGNERSVMLGRDLVLSPSLVRDERLDYVALGHIHKAQDLNEGGHHPVIYPGSIERVDFGEVQDRKTYVIAEIERNRTDIRQVDLPGRRFIDRMIEITSEAEVQAQILSALPDEDAMKDAMVRLVVRYPREWEPMIDEPAVRRAAEKAFEFHFIRRPVAQARIRLPEDVQIAALTSPELLDIFWKSSPPAGFDSTDLLDLASDIIQTVETGSAPAPENEQL
jgi:exonuclease SbcD